MRELPDSPSLQGTGSGGSVGSELTDGLAVEFDTYRNGWGPSDDHVGVNLLDQGNLIPQTALDLDQDLRTGVFDAEIILDGGRIRLYLSNAAQEMAGTLVMDYTLSGFVPFTGYVGIIGKTGAVTDKHVVHRARLWN